MAFNSFFKSSHCVRVVPSRLNLVPRIGMRRKPRLRICSHAPSNRTIYSLRGHSVVLISTRNEDGSTNVAPMSSAWWFGWSCMLGLGDVSHTTQNLLREHECVLNIPSVHQTAAVDRLARLTGSNPVAGQIEPHQSRQIASSHHELFSILRPGRACAAFKASRNSRGGLSAI
jgi:flavin reductase (DIM6/NTAB) family NADH-FMN oxidoreductase RutF